MIAPNKIQVSRGIVQRFGIIIGAVIVILIVIVVIIQNNSKTSIGEIINNVAQNVTNPNNSNRQPAVPTPTPNRAELKEVVVPGPYAPFSLHKDFQEVVNPEINAKLYRREIGPGKYEWIRVEVAKNNNNEPLNIFADRYMTTQKQPILEKKAFKFRGYNAINYTLRNFDNSKLMNTIFVYTPSKYHILVVMRDLDASENFEDSRKKLTELKDKFLQTFEIDDYREVDLTNGNNTVGLDELGIEYQNEQYYATNSGQPAQ